MDLVKIDAVRPVELHAAIASFARRVLSLIQILGLTAVLAFIHVDQSLGVEMQHPKQQLGKTDASEALLTGEGNALLALWADRVGKSGKDAIYYRLSVDSGKTFNPQQILVEGSGSVYRPKVATTAGFVHVCWYAFSDEIFYANVNLATGRASVPLGLSKSDSAQYCWISASDDVVVISWTKQISNGSKALVIAYSVDRGQRFSAPLELARTAAGGDFYDVSLATMPGKIFVGWSQATGKDTSEINLFSSAVPVARVRNPQTLSHPAARAQAPYVVTSGNNVVVAWSEMGLKVSVSKDSGATFSPPMPFIDPSDIPYPFTDQSILGGLPILTAAQNDVYLISDGRILGPNWQQVYFAWSSDGGAKFSALRLMSAFNIYAWGPQVFVTRDQKVVIVWMETGQAVDFIIARISALRGQDFHKEVRTSVNTIRGSSHFGVSVFVNDGTVFFLWVEGTPDNIATPIWLQALPIGEGITGKAR